MDISKPVLYTSRSLLFRQMTQLRQKTHDVYSRAAGRRGVRELRFAFCPFGNLVHFPVLILELGQT